MLQKTHAGRRFLHSIAQLAPFPAARPCRQIRYVLAGQAFLACGGQKSAATLLTFGQADGETLFARGELRETGQISRGQRLAFFVERAEQLGLDARQLIKQRADLRFEIERELDGDSVIGGHERVQSSGFRVKQQLATGNWPLTTDYDRGAMKS